jgi:uncharacterized protein (TIGR03086 family)
MNAVADRIAHLSDQFEAVISKVSPDAWSNPSPCSEWTARGVVRHIVDVHGMMLRPLERRLSAAPDVDDDPLGAFQAARADVATVLAEPQLAGTEYDGLFGRAVVEETIDGFLGFDLVVHRWDLARATGQRTHIEDDEVARIAVQAEHLGDALRTPGVCGPPVEVPAEASPADRLLGLLGRDPQWTPPLA